MYLVHMLDAAAILLALSGKTRFPLLAAGPAPRPLIRGGRCRVWNDQVGTFQGWTRDGRCRIALDGERTHTGAQSVTEWYRWQVEAVAS